MTKMYCVYCGRVAHRCACGAEASRAVQFFARAEKDFVPCWMPTPYKRGVPPQIKRRERATMRRNYALWYTAIAERDGEICANCSLASNEAELVVDHVISIAKGGLSQVENLQLLCTACNNIKGKLCIDCRIPKRHNSE